MISLYMDPLLIFVWIVLNKLCFCRVRNGGNMVLAAKSCDDIFNNLFL